MGFPRLRACGIAARKRQRHKGRERRIQEPSEPDALALTLFAHAVHAVVPVACPDERQSVPPYRQTCIEGEGAVLEKSEPLFGNCWLKEAVRFTSLKRVALEKGDHFVKHGRVLRRLDILSDRIGQPSTIVGYTGPDALPGMRQPPVLHVALGELAGGRAQQVLARQIGSGGGERHAVLQLVTKAVRAAGLVES